MRGLLISWLTGVHHQLNLWQDTLFVAVNVVDRVLDLMQASRDYLQLLGITSLLIACKSVRTLLFLFMMHETKVFAR